MQLYPGQDAVSMHESVHHLVLISTPVLPKPSFVTWQLDTILSSCLYCGSTVQVQMTFEDEDIGQQL